MLRAGLWHRGHQRMISADAPGAGKDWSIEIPEGPEAVFYQPLSVVFSLATSAVAGNRGLALVYAGGAQAGVLSNVFARSPLQSVIVANSSVRLCYMVDGPRNAVADAAGNRFDGNFLPRGLLLKPGERIATESLALDVGDAYTGILVVLQTWIFEPPGETTPAIGDGEGRVDVVALNALAGEMQKLTETLQKIAGAFVPTP